MIHWMVIILFSSRRFCKIRPLVDLENPTGKHITCFLCSCAFIWNIIIFLLPSDMCADQALKYIIFTPSGKFVSEEFGFLVWQGEHIPVSVVIYFPVHTKH